jgi:hypothetical protein
MSFEKAYRVEQRVRMLADHDARSWSVVGLSARSIVCPDTRSMSNGVGQRSTKFGPWPRVGGA